ncbi:MAG: DNA polymerase III subunit delta' [Pseudomonadota bacterium]|nr:DNA polymerase III subunit delta' [Pseudomonadota bacterium]
MKAAAAETEETALGPAPRDNPFFEGHEGAVATFLDAWAGGRIHHAWLLTGMQGIGKATLAYRIARFVLARGQGLEMVPDHPVFRLVSSGGHGDLLVAERQYDAKKGRYADGIAVDTVREIAPFLRLTSSAGGWRVVIVDGANGMNASSQNAILKILEEPPPRTLLLLTAENPGALLPTIRSRVRLLPLDPLPADSVVRLLDRYHPGLDPAERQALAHLAEGSIGRALALAGTGGLETYRRMVEFLESLPRLDPVRSHEWAEGFSRAGREEDFAVVAELMVWFLDRLVRAGATGQIAGEIFQGEGAAVQRLLSLCTLSRWMDIHDRIAQFLARGDTASLDRKQMLMQVLWILSSGVAGQGGQA